MKVLPYVSSSLILKPVNPHEPKQADYPSLILTSYTLKYTVFSATLSISLLFFFFVFLFLFFCFYFESFFFVYSTTCFGRIGPSSGVLLPKLSHCNLYIKRYCSFRCAYLYHLLDAFVLCFSFIAQVYFLTFKTFKMYVTFIKFFKTSLLIKTLLRHYSWVSSTLSINIVRLLYLAWFFFVCFVVLM
jgi:hypothetical protein